MDAIAEAELALNLTECPPEIQALDENAGVLWREFLKRTGISMSVDGMRVIDQESKRALVIRNFGVPSLVQRLPTARTELERARIWWRESVACSAGDAIPDLHSGNMHLLNPFILTKELKFPDSRTVRLAEGRAEREIEKATEVRRRGRPRKSAEEKRRTKAALNRKYRARARQSWCPPSHAEEAVCEEF